uniref:Uncharacterized protein n=1 Tax=Cannabis sativa TaxID=3483 RepID=A0A803QSH0_CANSA
MTKPMRLSPRWARPCLDDDDAPLSHIIQNVERRERALHSARPWGSKYDAFLQIRARGPNSIDLLDLHAHNKGQGMTSRMRGLSEGP